MSSYKLVGFRLSPTVEEILHVAELSKTPIKFENISWTDTDSAKIEHHNSPTITFPYLETPEGILSESKAIEYYLASNNPQLLGNNTFEKALIRQWFEFSEQLNLCGQEIYHPIFGWREYNKSRAERAEKRVNTFLQALNIQLRGKKYVCGNIITIADVSLFRSLKFYFQLVYPESKRNQYKEINDWFIRLLKTDEVKKVYGEFNLCKVPIKLTE